MKSFILYLAFVLTTLFPAVSTPIYGADDVWDRAAKTAPAKAQPETYTKDQLAVLKDALNYPVRFDMPWPLFTVTDVAIDQGELVIYLTAAPSNPALREEVDDALMKLLYQQIWYWTETCLTQDELKTYGYLPKTASPIHLIVTVPAQPKAFTIGTDINWHGY